MADIEFTVDDGVANILLNRPNRRNAFTMDMLKEWAAFLTDAQYDENIRVVTVTGAGGAFCAGVDLDDFASERSTPYSDKAMLTDRIHAVARAVEAFDKPYIAGVSGVAVGAGMDMALMADIRVAAAGARMSEAYIKVGLLPGDGGCHFLPRLVGKARALELLWTGDFVDAETAREIGLVNHVYEDDKFDTKLDEFARRLAAGPPLAMRMIKRATVHGETASLASSLDLISSHQAIIQSTNDSKEAMAAFKEKRTPIFSGQ
ncbi:enoyl-CoA hydratase/isomerase family protein [Rhodococcus opacus]|jgi:enoyl-CoA hydratase/carnithine racemase|uniref:enoyl-CoA hydratase/isomerase family protein n=1 Tax=Rhodococcus opacus TaxID=37919 RepID=UPI0024771F5B|nr:enoyl-CoA hydratase-related protein [Rhodococcus opacus]MDH6293296.1 enoyl-CoA hydratase/carnithine racemase [Rhodococcus opacus]